MRFWKLILVCGATLGMVVAATTLGGVREPLKLASEASPFSNPPALAQAQTIVEADQYATPPDDQYGARKDVCIDDILQMRLSNAEADHLIGGRLAELGGCTGPYRMPARVHGPVSDTGQRLDICIGGIVQLRASYDERDRLAADGIAVRGPCPAA